jgi:TolB-like protein
MKKFIEELKRRNVIKASLAYLVVTWVLLQVFSLLLPMLGAPEWLLPTITLIMAIGLPVWIIISWIYEITPEGIEKTTKDSGSELVAQATNKRLNVFIIVSLSIAVVVMGLKLSNVFTSDSNKQTAIAILPFDNIQVDKGNEWLSSGFTQDVNSYISKINKLQVTDSYSTGKYKDSKKTNSEIAKELDVSYILRGSVRQLKNKLSITVELIDVISNRVVWSESYEEIIKDNILNIQQKVSQKIVQELRVNLNSEEERTLEKFPTKSPEAFRLFTEGRLIADSRKKEDLIKSIELFQKAIDIDPEFANAYAVMANMIRLMPFRSSIYGYLEERSEKVSYLLEKAIEIDPNNSYAFSVLAMRYSNNLNWKKAKEYYEKAIASNPNNATAHHYFAYYFSSNPEIDNKKALEQINIAARLNPLSYPVIATKISILLNNDKFLEAEKLYKKNISFLNNRPGIQNNFIRAKARKISLEKKDWREAIKFYHKELEKDPENAKIHNLLAIAYNEILLDTKNYIKHAEKAYILDTTGISSIGRTHNYSLIKAKKYEELLQIIKGYNWDIPLITYYYYLGDYKKSQFYLDKYSTENSISQTIVYAQQNKIKKAYRILNKGNLANYEKARVFAILKEKDSMYHYINKEKDIYRIREFNSYFEVDPYRREERYKAFLKKNYLPITHWNE